MEVTQEVNYLEQVELYVTKVVTEEFSEKLIFSDMEHLLKVIASIKTVAQHEGLSEEDKEVVLIAGHLNITGMKDIETIKSKKDPNSFFTECHKCSINYATQFLRSINYPPDRLSRVIETMRDGKPFETPQTQLGKVLADGITSEWASKKGKKRIEARYQELLLIGVTDEGRGSFYEKILEYLQEHKYYTHYGRTYLHPKKDELVQKIEKERKELGKLESKAIKKELSISDAELKKLQKSLRSVKGRDERGIQTMFRTTSRNHYTLNQMVDRKANIMISVNAIILSLIVSRILGNIDTFCIHNLPLLILMISSVASIFFAVIAITPARSHGEFTEQEIRAKEGNLLYFGNFHNMRFRDYNWGMLQMLNDSDYLYTSMIKDLYFMGQMLSTKYNHIRRALAIFVIGLILTVVSFLVVGTVSEFHFGEPHSF